MSHPLAITRTDRKPRMFPVLALAFLAAAAMAAAGGVAAQTEADRQEVRQAVFDYVEAIYEVDPSRIERSVHTDLTKMGYYAPPRSENAQLLTMNYEQLLELAANFNKDGGQVPEGAPKSVEIFDLLDRTASAKLTASWGVDYLLLSKEEGRWKIRLILWQSLPAAENE